MKTYIDSECKCHTTNVDGSFREFEVKFFDGKCQTFVEGHRYCPEKEKYTREDGKVFEGECIVPWKPSAELEAAQVQYEADLAEVSSAYQEGVDSV